MADDNKDIHFLERLRGKMKPAELAEATGVGERTIWNIEHRIHRPRRDTCVPLYEYFKRESKTDLTLAAFIAAMREEEGTAASSAARPPLSPETLDRATIEALLRNGRYGRAGFCAYLMGDYSILLTRVAVGIPPHAFVHAAVEHRPTGGPSTAQVYYRHGPGRWRLDETMSERMSRHLTRALSDEAAPFPGCPASVHAVIASELPDGAALYEESAMSLALAAALVPRPESESAEDHFETLRFAAHLVRQWYCDVSWATLAIGSFEPDSEDRRVLRFDRTHEEWDVDLATLYNVRPRQPTTEYEDRQLRANFFPEKKYWNTESLPFNTDQIEIWWDGRRSNVDEVTIRRKFKEFRQLPFAELTKRFCDTIVDGGIDGERRLGLMMQLHQLMLASVDFIDSDAQKVIASVNGLSRFVLGAKLASGRVRGAFVVLIDRGIDHDEFDHSMRELGLLPLAEFRSPLKPRAAR